METNEVSQPQHNNASISIYTDDMDQDDISTIPDRTSVTSTPLTPSQPDVSSDFIRYLRLNCYDILCLQETHVNDMQTELTMSIKFQSTSSIWSTHCGIISLNPSILLESLFITLDQRIIACQVTHINGLFPPTTIINIYAPAQYGPRKIFFDYVMQLPIFQDEELYPFSSTPDSLMPVIRPMLVLDSISNHSSQRLWHEFLNRNLMERTHSRDSESFVPTFRRGASSSTIDYIFASPILAQQLIESKIEFINSEWTDHAALSVTFKFISSRQGTGMWRANPQLLRNPYFISSLKQKIESFFLEDSTSLLSNQETWDAIKLITKPPLKVSVDINDPSNSDL
ncbi:hypothetical protein HPULCUR_000476 [Helicostylum pulchrum]|uniref:Endonuclease/exonuclease/phosphatase domain-containing protein n=1 Tax=Helicostylum pulchrum TaxID=562976 RepID=A0ABP9XK20_9FUNG